MPKIIEEIKSTILTEAKRQLLQDGYSGMTLRSVAVNCRIAVGTIYNYFKSKDALIASFMLADWTAALAKMKVGCSTASTPSDVFACVHHGIVDYSDEYAKLFTDAEARRSADIIFASRHSMLRAQIVSLIADTCRKNAIQYSDYLPEFIAEAILSFASEAERKDFSLLSEILVQLFKSEPHGELPLK